MQASFNTTKTAEGYSWKVYEVVSSATPLENGSYAKFITRQTGVKATRAQALGIAKKWTLYYRKGGK